jgi:hypothetical protein
VGRHNSNADSDPHPTFRPEHSPPRENLTR